MSEVMLPVARSVAELRRRTAAWRAAGEPIGLMPRMGALHSGHLALVAAAQVRCRRVVVSSIFVNRKQFGPREDFSTYPRPVADGEAPKNALKPLLVNFVQRSWSQSTISVKEQQYLAARGTCADSRQRLPEIPDPAAGPQ